MPASKPHHAERAVELRSVWSAPDVVLFLEFPFTLNHFEFTISLSPNELQSYSQKAFVVSRRSRKKSRKFSAKNTG